MRVAIVGRTGGPHIGGSLHRAAAKLGHEVRFFDIQTAHSRISLLEKLSWRLNDRKPVLLGAFGRRVAAELCRDPADALIATGMAPLAERHLRALRTSGVRLINYSTDDPWNRQSARWHLRALPAYHVVYTPRRANMDDFRRLGCADVRCLPFGYDEDLFAPPAGPSAAPSHDVLFVGGADADRVQFMTAFVAAGSPVALIGDYWERYPATRQYALGKREPEALGQITAAAKVNLCLVRRSNRDGHVMRSFEIAAVGGCMLAEDTPEHREIFGPDGAAVAYFRSPEGAADRARALLADPAGRARLAAEVRARIGGGAHTYRARLATMLEPVENWPA